MVHREFVVLISLAVRLSRGCILDMTLDEVSLFYMGAIAATRRTFCVRIFGAFPMQVATTTPQTSRRLLSLGPDMA
jgi:hypothetical protein